MSDVLDAIETHIPALRRYARALTGNADMADDLVQDCLERAIRKRGLFSPGTNLRSWLFSILLNLFRNAKRKDKRARFESIDAMPVDPAQAPAQPGRLALNELSRAMARLADEQREALLLIALEGMSYAEAAKVLGIPVGTLMSRLGRARANLRIMTGEAGEPRLRAVK